MKPTNPIYTGLPTTIFEVMSRLAIEHKAINLGQGFPDVDGPEDVAPQRRRGADRQGPNQYPPMMGVLELRQAVAEANRALLRPRCRSGRREVLVTSGATEALSDCINALIEPGDEVVLIEPLYDCYLPLVKRAGAMPRLVRVTPPDWRLDARGARRGLLAAHQGDAPQQPDEPGRQGLFARRAAADRRPRASRHDAIAICDEVYEHIVFDGRPPRSDDDAAGHARADRARSARPARPFR